MMGDLRQELAEMETIQTKATAAEELCVMLENAIGYMIENGMGEAEVAEHIGCSVNMIAAINDEDYEYIANNK
jgi:hypothetical protein